MFDKKTQTVQKKYNRFSRFYNFLERGIEKKFSTWRKGLLGSLKGKILEVGIGTGKNLPHYNKNAKVIGIDLSSKMLVRAREKLKLLKNKNVKLKLMDAQKLKFKDDSFDFVVCTFVLCSVPNPVKVLKEMKRTCKKDGKILMLEHVLSNYLLIKLFQYVHNPITRTFFGFNVNRDTVGNIKNAGLKINKEVDMAFFDVFKKIEIINENG
jgi:demethylmenaquinone methyltransferase/2-methoxy-6-polyprenyl-1,4-benzoquinol methylase